MGRFFFYCAQIQNLQNYGLCGILDIEKDNRPQGGLPSLVKKNPLRTRQSRGAVFLCLGYLQYWKINVSNARMNIPKSIKSWKEKFFIDITSIPEELRQHHPASGSHQANRLRLLGCYHMERISQSATSFGLASWMRSQHGCRKHFIINYTLKQ